MIRVLMPKDFQSGDFFKFSGIETWFRVNHVNVFADGSAAVWTTNTDGKEDVCPFFKDEGPYTVRRAGGVLSP